MSNKINEYTCECGSRAVYVGLKDSYPSYRCTVCEKQWLVTTCWNGGARHIIDERFAKKCSICNWWHCNTCGACLPKEHGECPCNGSCS